MIELDLGIVALLLVAALAAGWLDAVGGGGGLIQLPALLIALPPQYTVMALGTNKVSSIIGTTAAAANYARKISPPRFTKPMMIAAFAGSGLGSILATRLNPELYRPVIFVVLVGMWIFMVLNPTARLRGLEEDVAHSENLFKPVLYGVGLGFYDGAIGPGFGAFLLLALVHQFGMSFLHSSVTAKFVNVATNAASILVFAVTGNVLWLLGLMMGCINLVGGLLGSSMAMRFGSGFVRRVLLSAVALLIVRLGFSIWG